MTNEELQKLKELAQSVIDTPMRNGSSLTDEYMRFADEASPSAILKLIARIDELDTPFCVKCGSTEVCNDAERSLSSVGAAGVALSDERDSFECEVLRLDIIDDEGLERDNSDHYVDEPAEAAWKAWQARAILAAAAPAPQQEPLVKASAVPEQVVDDLAMLVRQLAHALRNTRGESSLAARAVDYLKRKGLQGSPLRAAPKTEEAQAVGSNAHWPTQQATSGQPSHVQLSIDTRELSTLMTVWLRADEGDEAKEAYDAVVAHIDAKLTQARKESYRAQYVDALEREAVKGLKKDRDEWKHAAMLAANNSRKMTEQLAAIRAGLERLTRYWIAPGGSEVPDPDGDLLKRDDALALFGPGGQCDICSDTGVTFGKRCECRKGATA